MDSRNHFITWSKQRSRLTLDIAEAKDFRFRLATGEWIDDGLSNTFNCAFGYSESRIKNRMSEVLKDFPCASSKWNLKFRVEQTARLLDFVGLEEGRIFYSVSGAEAIENALKIARLRRGANKILSRSLSYHGASLGALSVGGDWRTSAVETVKDWTVRIPEPSQDPEGEKLRALVESTGADSIAAFCLETVTATNGVLEAPSSWWKAVSEICQRTGILLILDEVTSGFYRCGEPFAFQAYPLKPDFVCMSKSISGGYAPFGAVYVSKSISKTFDSEVLPCGGTNFGSPIGVAAMAGVLDLLEDRETLQLIASNTKKFNSLMSKLGNQTFVKNLRVAGMLAALDLEHQAPESSAFIEAGVHVYRKDKMIILAPPLTVDENTLQRIVEKTESVLEGVAK